MKLFVHFGSLIKKLFRTMIKEQFEPMIKTLFGTIIIKVPF